MTIVLAYQYTNYKLDKTYENCLLIFIQMDYY